jgi:peptide/nickel transport system substrate-binding protein
MLATAWKWDSTNTQLMMTLRKGVQFQDGSPLNADVVVQNLKNATAPGANSPQQLATMTGVVAVDPYTVRLTFRAPDPAVLYAFASYAGMMVSEGGLAHPNALPTQPAGAGPYQLESVSASLTFNLVHWDGYWDKSHVFPLHWQSVQIVDENARVNSLTTGTADFTPILSAAAYSTVKNDKNLQLVQYPALDDFVLFMNNIVSPLDDINVRRAVQLALNRETFEQAQDGLCIPAGQTIPPGMLGYDKSLSLQTNVSQTKQLIQQAGATGKKITLITLNVQPWPTFAQLIQAQLDAIGLNVQSQQAIGSSFRVLYSQGHAGMLLATTVLSAPDPGGIFDTYYLGVLNPGTKDPAFAAQIRSADTLPLGSSQRADAFEAINQAVQSNYLPWTPICQQVNTFAATKQVIGLNAIPNATLTGEPSTAVLQIAK